jgi:hypothetical protein
MVRDAAGGSVRVGGVVRDGEGCSRRISKGRMSSEGW